MKVSVWSYSTRGKCKPRWNQAGWRTCVTSMPELSYSTLHYLRLSQTNDRLFCCIVACSTAGLFSNEGEQSFPHSSWSFWTLDIEWWVCEYCSPQFLVRSSPSPSATSLIWVEGWTGRRWYIWKVFIGAKTLQSNPYLMATSIMQLVVKAQMRAFASIKLSSPFKRPLHLSQPQNSFKIFKSTSEFSGSPLKIFRGLWIDFNMSSSQLWNSLEFLKSILEILKMAYNCQYIGNFQRTPCQHWNNTMIIKN